MMPIAGFLCGFIFGWGLLISGMLDPAKVLAFLDIFGAWDPSLAVVMAAALAVSGAGFVLAQRRRRPAFAVQSELPSRTAIDAPLAVGAVMFGAGWGLVGLCPGPAVENLATLSPPVIVFVAAMVLGMVLHDLWQRRRATSAKRPSAVPAAADG